MKFYVLSLKHSPAVGLALWWRPEAKGYTTNLSQAGLFAAEEIEAHPEYYDNGTDSRAIPQCQVDKKSHLVVDWNEVRPA